MTPYLNDRDVRLYLGDALNEAAALHAAPIQFLAPEPKDIAASHVLVREALVRDEARSSTRIREVAVTGDFRAMLAPFCLEVSESDDCLGILALDSEVRENESQGELRLLVTDLPSVEEAPVLHPWGFRVVPPAECLGEEANPLLVDHTHHQNRVIPRRHAAGKVPVCLGLLDSDVALAIDQAGAVSNLDFSSHIPSVYRGGVTT